MLPTREVADGVRRPPPLRKGMWGDVGGMWDVGEWEGGARCEVGWGGEKGVDMAREGDATRVAVDCRIWPCAMRGA